MFLGKNIKIRPMEDSDLLLKNKWINDVEINKTLLFDYPFSLSETKEWFKRTFFKRNRWDFIIEETKTNKVIGMTGLININLRHRNSQFFITIGEKEFWGKGYSREVIPLVLKFGFLELGLEKIYLYTLEDNLKARTIYEKLGFKQEAYKINEYFIHGELKNLYHHAMLKSEFEKYLNQNKYDYI